VPLLDDRVVQLFEAFPTLLITSRGAYAQMGGHYACNNNVRIKIEFRVEITIRVRDHRNSQNQGEDSRRYRPRGMQKDSNTVRDSKLTCHNSVGKSVTLRGLDIFKLLEHFFGQEFSHKTLVRWSENRKLSEGDVLEVWAIFRVCGISST
jgi:hypothetical protein